VRLTKKDNLVRMMEEENKQVRRQVESVLKLKVTLMGPRAWEFVLEMSTNPRNNITVQKQYFYLNSTGTFHLRRNDNCFRSAVTLGLMGLGSCE